MSYKMLRVAAAALAVALNFTTLASAQFETRGISLTNHYPSSIAVGDFDHDGNLDVAVVAGASYTKTIAILLGKGDGTFRQALTYTAGIGPYSVVTADFNHDGNIDLAVGSQSSYISILLGNGDGTFQMAAQTPAVPAFERFITVGDFNDDGKLDIVGRSDGNNVSVLMGNGDGTFQPAVITQLPFSLTALGVGDFNGDGKLDVATAGDFSVNILLGNGNGTFQYGASYPGGVSPNAIVVADFNGDQRLDLAVANSADAGVDVLLGNGDGTFQTKVDYSSPGPYWVTAADVNGDHKLDLVTVNVNGFGGSGATVLLGNGDGTFETGTFYPGIEEAVFVATGDFNGDGRRDLVVADGGYNDVVTLLNTGAIAFSPTTPLTFPFQLVGTTSPSQTASLSNLGTTPIRIVQMKATGAFDMVTTCGSSLAVGATCSVTATFSPTTQGAKIGTVTINDSASSKPQVIELTGEGTIVQLSPASLIFPMQKVGTTSQPQIIKLTNRGTTPLNITQFNINGYDYRDFSQNNNCPSSLDPKATCAISVSFTPTNTGTRTAFVYIYDTGGGSPQTVPLIGTGK